VNSLLICSQNFKIYPGLAPNLQSKQVSFVGHDDGVSQPYRLRLKTEEQATELKAALDREIAAVNSD
jgi:nucleoporin NUP2